MQLRKPQVFSVSRIRIEDTKFPHNFQNSHRNLKHGLRKTLSTNLFSHMKNKLKPYPSNKSINFTNHIPNNLPERNLLKINAAAIIIKKPIENPEIHPIFRPNPVQTSYGNRIKAIQALRMKKKINKNYMQSHSYLTARFINANPIGMPTFEEELSKKEENKNYESIENYGVNPKFATFYKTQQASSSRNKLLEKNPQNIKVKNLLSGIINCKNVKLSNRLSQSDKKAVILPCAHHKRICSTAQNTFRQLTKNMQNQRVDKNLQVMSLTNENIKKYIEKTIIVPPISGVYIENIRKNEISEFEDLIVQESENNSQLSAKLQGWGINDNNEN